MVLSEKFDTEGDINQVGKYLIKLHDGIENYLKIQCITSLEKQFIERNYLIDFT